jgi:tartrate dehydratase alpha subunit/fumarate hydratase class I-like protein
MEELERINQVEQLLVNTKELMKSIDEMFYKKKYNEIEKYKSIEETDKKFRRCRELLLKNMKDLKECLDTNFNLFLALQLHLTVMTKEIQKLEEVVEEVVDPLTVKEEDVSSESEDSTESEESNNNKLADGVIINMDSSEEDDLYIYCKKCGKESETFCLNGYCKECR